MWQTESMMADSGGWGGDTTMMQTNSGGPNQLNLEKVAIPVRVPRLVAIPSGEEKLTFGTYSFSTVRVVGRVVAVANMGQYVEYRILDVQDETRSTIVALDYNVTGESSKSTLIEETLVEVIGKLRSFDQRLSIMSYNIRELDSESYANTHRLESRLAELYYIKNVPQMALNNDLGKFAGTMFRGAAHAESSPSKMPSSSFARPSAMTANNPHGATPLYNQIAQSTGSTASSSGGNDIGLKGQQKLIYDHISRTSRENERGARRDQLYHIPGINKATLDRDLDFLFNEGHIYTTVDEEHLGIC